MTCLVVEGWGFKRLPDFVAHLRREVLKPRELLMLSVPSLLYTLQNNLLYIALANLDAAIYQVCYQLKILTTALFSVLLLKRALSRTKWMSLVILTVGVSLTELDAHKVSTAAAANADPEANEQSPTLGFLCVLMACLTSGFAGVWFEKILKGVGSSSSSSKAGGGSGQQQLAGQGPSPSKRATTPAISMWIRNIQMGATSVAMALLAVYSKDRALVLEKGFFYGYTRAVVGVVLLQALGGLVVALVVVHADNIMKGFGSSISIVLSCVLEWLFFDFQPTLRFVLGAGLVNFALYVFQKEDKRPPLGNGGLGVGGGGGKDMMGAGAHHTGGGVGPGASREGHALLPFVHIPKSHPHDAKGWFGARKTSPAPPSTFDHHGNGGAAAVQSGLSSLKPNAFDSTATTPAGGVAEWRQPRAREVATKASLV